MASEEKSPALDRKDLEHGEHTELKGSQPEQKDPVPEQKDPVPEKKDTVPEQKDPVLEKKDPVPEQKDPVPEQKDPVPEQKDSVPEEKDPVPEKKDQVPEQKDPVPEQKDSVPEKKDPVSEKKDPVPEKKDPVPEKKDPVLEKKDPVPEKKDPVPEQKDPVSEQKDPVSEKKDPVPEQKDPVSEQKDPVSEKKDPVPEQKDPVSEKKDPVPEKKDPVLEQKDPVSEQKDPVPEKKDPVPEKKDPVPEKKDPVLEQKDPVPEQKDPVPEKKDQVPEKKDPMPEQKDSVPEKKDPVPKKNPVSDQKSAVLREKDEDDHEKPEKTDRDMDGGATKVQKDVNLQRIRDRAQRLRSDLIDHLGGQLTEMLEEFAQDIETIEQPCDTMNGSSMPKTRRDKGPLPDKEFIARRSVLTDLLEITHIRTIYHIFVAILIVFSLNTIVYDFIEHGRMVLDFDIIVWAFGKFPIVMTLWMAMTFSTVVIYPLFQFWAYNRKPGRPGWQDFVWLGLYFVYQILFLVLPVRLLRAHQLPPASTVVIACEQVRLLMKCHAFVRENITRALMYNKLKVGEGGPETPCPDFSKYLYFLFAPTLVYRDQYPRTPKIRWNYVVSNFAQVWACLLYTYYIFARFCIPVFHNFSREHVTPRALIMSVFSCVMPATLVLFIGFFAILHSWLNAFAEMLRFADRLFYKDWWNSSSFANYYRTWNVVVHDWLYSYVYKEMYNFFGVPSRPVAMASVFLLSAVFHEYILSVSFGFFYPVLFVMFAGAGFGFLFLPNKGAPRSGNVFLWVALFIGTGLLMCLYSMEWYARQNCKPTSDVWLVDSLFPRSWSCDFNEELRKT